MDTGCDETYQLVCFNTGYEEEESSVGLSSSGSVVQCRSAGATARQQLCSQWLRAQIHPGRTTGRGQPQVGEVLIYDPSIFDTAQSL